jgi:hypothetical protein
VSWWATFRSIIHDPQVAITVLHHAKTHLKNIQQLITQQLTHLKWVIGLWLWTPAHLNIIFFNCKIFIHFLRSQNFMATNLVRDVNISEVGRGETGHTFYFSLLPTSKQCPHLEFCKVAMIYSQHNSFWWQGGLFFCLTCDLWTKFKTELIWILN